MNDRAPCLIGVAQKTFAKDSDAPEPLKQWEMIAYEAAKDAGNENIIAQLKEVNVIFPTSWTYEAAEKQLAESLGLPNCRAYLSGLSGTSPQKMLNEAAEKILEGEIDCSLIVGGEAFATRKRAKKEGRKLGWLKVDNKPQMPFDDPFISTEMVHQIYQVYLTFAVLDSARRQQHNLTHAENRQQQAEMMSALSKIAAGNPNSWFPQAYCAKELFSTAADNRTVAYPFTKHSMAFMDVDMCAGLIITSHEKADELDVPQAQRVYLNGWGYAKSPPYIAQRKELWHSPEMKAASKHALDMAGTDINNVQHLDLYSCFSSALSFVKDALGIADDDPRPLTITGGLPYFGGPGSNYCTHSIAAMVERLRRNPGDNGLITGVGMHMTNHVFAVYSTEPTDFDRDIYQQSSDVTARSDTLTIQDEADGPATIAGYTVIHERENTWGLAICDLPNGNRCYAHINDADILASLETEEWVGRDITLATDNKINSVVSA